MGKVRSRLGDAVPHIRVLLNFDKLFRCETTRFMKYIFVYAYITYIVELGK